MTYIQRSAYKKLISWKNREKRKPLLIRGARQVGKTTLVRKFSKEYSSYIELNLERESDRALFEVDDVEKILDAAYFLKGVIPADKSNLLFIDEIQESPKAIQMLRYFHEERPDLHVIAAGSLLEFALNKVPSFPVGRIEYLYLYPVNFSEYLASIKKQQALEMMHKIPVPDYAHSILLDFFHDYALVGGMPEILSDYIQNKSLVSLSSGYHRLWQSFKDDVEKYAQNKSDKKVIRHIIETAPFEKDRIKFERFGSSNYRSREVGEALRSLDLAKLIQLIYPTTSIKLPIVTDFKKSPRLQFIDTGLLNQILLLQGKMIGLKSLDNFHQGKIIQHLVTQELISIHQEINYKPNFWVRESKNSNAEVDLVYQHAGFVIPIEVKSGKQGSLKSLHQYVERSEHPYAVRMFAGKFEVQQAKTPGGIPYLLMSLPYYLGTVLPEYLDYFVKNFSLKNA